VAREFEPVVGQWYENIDENDSFRVLSVDADRRVDRTRVPMAT
jgi:hypothetical protein